MKITRYLWINNLPKHCDEEEIQKTFQSHGKIQTIRIHENNRCRGAIVAFIDCKSSTKAYDSVKTLQKMTLKLEYCDANGEPGITTLGLSRDCSKNENDSQSRSSSSSSSNTSSFGSSLDDCSKYPPIQFTKRLGNTNYVDDEFERSSTKSTRSKPTNDLVTENADKNDKECLNSDYRGLLVENLSQRSSDTSLREGLFHEYKKHGKITSVAVMGQGGGRHAIISFKRSEDMEKAFEVSQGKIFFGNPIRVKKHNGYNYIDPDLCPPEHAMDEYHPKATKTLFVGKLATGAVVELDLRKVFKKYGEIIDIDIKTQSNQPDTSFAFVQYYDISSVVRALRNQDGIKVDGKPVKLGFGKSQPANCLWVGNLQRNANESFLRRHFKRFGTIMLVIPDPEYNCALIQFESAEDALRAFTDTRERSNNSNNMNRRMQVDYASNEYQMAFMNRLRKSCQFDSQDFLKNISDPYQTEKIQNLLISYTKYLGLLDETRNRSYDRYDTKSDYDDYEELFSSRSSRQRKSVHQRLYNDSYGIDEDYSDEYHYSKPKPRHYDEYSSSRSPVRYSRSRQRYAGEQYDSHNSRRSNYQHYTGEYYENKPAPSSSAYYPYRRTPDPSYIHSNHNRSYTPSPTSSFDYCDDYPRYNLSPKRYSRSNKEYHSSRSRQMDLKDHHFDRVSETRNWSRPARRDFDDYSLFLSKSGSKSKSPRLKTVVRSMQSESAKKVHSRRTTNNETIVHRSSINKVVPNTSNINKSIKISSNNLSVLPAVSDSTKPNVDAASVASVVQPVDALSKLERERAKLLAELSLLSEDSTPNKSLKTSVPKVVVTDDTAPTKSQKKPLIFDNTLENINNTDQINIKVEATLIENRVPASEKMPLFDIATLACSDSIKKSSTEISDKSTTVTTPDPITVALSVSIDQPMSSLPRDPRLSTSHSLIRSLSYNPTLSKSEPIVVALPITNSYKDSASDSDLDHLNNIDSEVDKRIRELDAKMNRNEQTIRILDYSKFRIRKKGNDNNNNGLTTTVTTPSTTSPSSLLSPNASMVTSSSLLDVGYSTTSRETGSNTSEFIKTMLNQTKPKNYHLLSDNNADHLNSICSSLPFRTVDLGANDIERRTLLSRYASSTSSSLSFVDIKVNVDTYTSRLPTPITVSTITQPKLVISPTTTVSTPSTPNTPNPIDSNQPMKSILKKSNAPCPIVSSSYKLTDPLPFPRNKSAQDLLSSTDAVKKLSTPTLKRKNKCEPESVDCKPLSKKSRNDNGPVLDDTLFQTYPRMPTKKLKKTLRKPFTTLPKASDTKVVKKCSLTQSLFNSSTVSEKPSSKKIERTTLINEPHPKTEKTFKECKKASSKLSKSKSAANLTRTRIRKGKSKTLKLEKAKKLAKRCHEKRHYHSRSSDHDADDDMDRFSDDNSEDRSTDNDNYESMYDKIKRRNNKVNRINAENKRRHALGLKRHNKTEFATVSSDNLDSEDSEYWSVQSSKRSVHQKRKRPRLSDISSSHFSDSNSCKTTPCGKSQDTKLLLKSEVGNGTVLFRVKDESITDESKAPAESFNLSSPHNSSQCSSPKYGKEVNGMSSNKELFESNSSAIHTKSLHRPNDGPLKKRPIAEPIILSEDLPYLEKQPEEECIASSPTSNNDEPPGQLESIYDIPLSLPPNMLEEEVVIDDQHHSEYTFQDHAPCDIVTSPLPADVNSASQILLTMKSQPITESDEQLQSVAEHLISLAQNAGQMSLSIQESPVEEDKLQITVKQATTVKPDDEVTIYVKSIIDRIKHETDVANTLHKDKLACKRAKKSNTFNIPLSKPMSVGNMNHECRHILPIDMDSSSRLVSTTVTTAQQVTLATVSSSSVVVTTNQIPDTVAPITKTHSSRSSQIDEKRSVQSDESASISSIDKRIRHNSAKSDGPLQSLDETIDNVVKSSMSSSASDAVSTKSVNDIDVNMDENANVLRSDLSSLEETMNEVINKMNVDNTLSTNVSSQSTVAVTESEVMKPLKPPIGQESNKQKKLILNHVKQPVYQLTSNVGGIANLVLGIPSILTVNTIVSQQNSLNHMVSFQNSVSGQTKLSNQLTLNSSLKTSSISNNNSSTHVLPSMSLTPANINIQGMQPQNTATNNIGVQSTDMMFTQLNPLTPIMIQSPLRNITPNNIPQQALISNRSTVNTMAAALVSIPTGVPMSNVALTASINKPISTPINVVPRSPLTSAHNFDPNYYLMLQRQTSQSKTNIPNLCQPASTDVNASHSIILSQLTHTSSGLSPITPGFLSTSMNRPNSSTIPLSTTTTNNGVATSCSNTTPSILFKPLSNPFSKFEEKNDWLKQNSQLELNYPIRWTGKLCLKNDEVFVQMHMLAGNEDLIKNSMNLISAGQDSSQPLRIVQRMRLEPNQLEGLQRRLTHQLEFCTCLTLAGGDKTDELTRTSLTLHDNFIKYLQDKSAAGIINISIPDSQQIVHHSIVKGQLMCPVTQNAYVIHIFPPCEFSDNQLKSCSATLYEKLKENSVPYLVIVITTV